MFNSWMFYTILGLSATVGALGWLSVSLHDDKVTAKADLKQATDAVLGYQNALNKKYLSCQIDDASVVEVEAGKKGLQTKIEVISDNIEKLRLPKGNPPVAAKQENIKNENLKPNVLPDDGLLSDNIVSLLKQGYCTTYPNDNECLPK